MVTRVDHTIAIVVPVYRGEDTLSPLLEEIDTYAVPRRRRPETGTTSARSCSCTTPAPTAPTSPSARCGDVRLRPPRLARAQLRPARRDARRHVEHQRRLDRHHGRGRPARPRGDRGDAGCRARDALRRWSTPPRPTRPRTARSATLSTGSRTSRLAPHGRGRPAPLPHLPAGSSARVGRGLAAYCGESVYLDVALTWVVSRTAPPARSTMRQERGRPVGILDPATRLAFLANGAHVGHAAAADSSRCFGVVPRRRPHSGCRMGRLGEGHEPVRSRDGLR